MSAEQSRVVTSASRPCPLCGESRFTDRFRDPPFLIVSCARCGLTYLLNPPDEEALYEDYHGVTTFAGAEYRGDSSDSRMRELFAINEQRVSALSSLHTGGRLLDVGCGRGEFLVTCRSHGYDVRGLDVSASAVQFARDSYGLDVNVQSIAETAERPERFDVITMWHVLEHFAEPLSQLRNVGALLAPGGLLAVEVPNLRSLKFQLSRNKWVGGNSPLYHRTFFTASSLRAMLTAAGFNHVRRVLLSYRIPGHRHIYSCLKRILNTLGSDSFLMMVADDWRGKGE